MAVLNTESKIQKLKAEIRKLEQKESLLVARKQAKALASIAALVKAAGLDLAQVTEALGKRAPKRKTPRAAKKSTGASKLAGRKIAPKYRNPANARETWAGRGRAPKWAADLKTAGKLEAALIK